MKNSNKIKLILVGLVIFQMAFVYIIFQAKQQEDSTAYMLSGVEAIVTETISNHLTDDLAIIASTDLDKKTEAAVIAKVGHSINFTIPQMTETDTIEVMGDHNYVEKMTQTDSGWTWVPARAGNFKIVIKDSEGQERTSRMVNVSDVDDDNYYQLTNLETKESEEGVSFNTSIYNKPKNTKGNEAQAVTAFTIGEPGIWSKTVKVYDDDRTSIVEGKDFLMDRGTYSVRASLKDKYSINDEDAKSTTYTKAPKDGHKVTIDHIDHQVIVNEAGESSDQFIVEAKCDHGCDLAYAFFVSDEISEKRLTDDLNGYVETNKLTCPCTPWQYNFTVRVKHKENSDGEQIAAERLLLPNSYEAMQVYTVEGKTIDDHIDIESVEIQPFILEDYYKAAKSSSNAEEGQAGWLEKQIINVQTEKGTVYANNNNYITVNIGKDEPLDKIVYSAWVVDDGESINLDIVDDEESNGLGNKFIYYPRSGGKKGVAADSTEIHKLYIMLSELGDEGYSSRSTTLTIDLNVE